MLAIALILLPDFALILLGLALRRRFDYPAAFWGHLENEAQTWMTLYDRRIEYENSEGAEAS